MPQSTLPDGLGAGPEGRKGMVGTKSSSLVGGCGAIHPIGTGCEAKGFLGELGQAEPVQPRMSV